MPPDHTRRHPTAPTTPAHRHRAITSRLHALAHTDPCDRCTIPATEAVADIAGLLLEVTRLYGALIDARLRIANLTAAIRAALAAHADGEADPIAYLRDEVAESGGWWE